MESEDPVYEMMLQLSYLMREPHIRVDGKYPKVIAGIDMTLLLFIKDGIHLTEIARRLDLTKGAVTYRLTRLEKKGLIKRHDGVEGDRRVARITLTKKGLTKFWERMNATIDESKEILSVLNKDEMKEYAALTNRMYWHSTPTD